MIKKTLQIILLSLTIISLVACKHKDDENTYEIESKIKDSKTNYEWEENDNDKSEIQDKNIPENAAEEIQSEAIELSDSQVKDNNIIEDDNMTEDNLPKVLITDDFVMKVSKIYETPGEGIAAEGEVLSGSASIGAEIEILSRSNGLIPAQITSIRVKGDLVDNISVGDYGFVALPNLEGKDLDVGECLVTKGLYMTYNSFLAKMKFIEEKEDSFYNEILKSRSYILVTDTYCNITFDKSSLDDNGYIMATFELITPLYMSIGTEFELREGFDPIAYGEVISFDLSSFSVETSIEENDSETMDSSDNDEGTGIRIKLIDSGSLKIQVIKEIRDIFGLGLKEAKDITDNVPYEFTEILKMEEAIEIKTRLEEYNAIVEIID
jgi:ribosomal protein L7/L12